MSHQNESFSVKVYFEKIGCNPEIRRFRVDHSSYQTLVRKLEEVFPVLLNSNEKFEFLWKDQEGDMITFSSDQEVKEAVGNSQDKVVRVYIKEKRSPKVEIPKKDVPCGEDPRGVLHPHVVCDGCEGAVYGCRYKCNVCPDFDLCAACHGQGKHPEHDMTAITNPQMPWTWKFGPACPPPPYGSWSDNIPSNVRNNWFRHCRRFMERMGGASGHPGSPSGGCCSGGGSHARTGSEAKTAQGCQSQEFRSNATYLRNVGETVAAMLDPFGIDVKVDVETDDGVRHRVGVSAMPEENPAKPAEEKVDNTEMKVDTEKASNDIKTAQGSDNDDWTLLTDREIPLPTSEQADVRIAEALEQMKAMGFENDGGWLTHLLQAKGGDISRVLDAIQAKRN